MSHCEQVAVVTGQVAQFLVQQNWDQFLKAVARFAVIGVPAVSVCHKAVLDCDQAVINSGLKYFTNMLSLRFRRQLTEHINRQYIVGVVRDITCSFMTVSIELLQSQ